MKEKLRAPSTRNPTLTVLTTYLSAMTETLKNCPEVALSNCTHVDPIVATWKTYYNKYDKIFYFNPYLGNSEDVSKSLDNYYKIIYYLQKYLI